MVGEGEHAYYFCAVVQVISSPLVHNLEHKIKSHDTSVTSENILMVKGGEHGV